MQRLEDMVASLLESNRDLRIRIGILDYDHQNAAFPTSALQTRRSRNTFIPKAFEDVLNRSRVYRRAEGRLVSLYSLSSAQRQSLAMSAFSDLSLGNVSIISVLCLPVWSSDLKNGYHYRFGQAGLELTMRELEEQYPGVIASVFTWPDMAAPAWSVKALFYTSLVMALGAVGTATQQSVALARFGSGANGTDRICKLFRSRGDAAKASFCQLYIWHIPIWLLGSSLYFFAAALAMLAWAVTKSAGISVAKGETKVREQDSLFVPQHYLHFLCLTLNRLSCVSWQL